MAKQPQTKRPAPNRSGKQPAKAQSRPVKRERAESTPGEMMWKMALILCTGLVIFSLLFASINGGSMYVGLTDSDKDTETTPTPPMATIDPNLDVQGSDMTPIPPSAAPEGDAAVQDGADNGQAPTP